MTLPPIGTLTSRAGFRRARGEHHLACSDRTANVEPPTAYCGESPAGFELLGGRAPSDVIGHRAGLQPGRWSALPQGFLAASESVGSQPRSRVPILLRSSNF